MTYSEAIAYLYDTLPMYQHIGNAAYRANLDNSYVLAEYLNYPHQKYKTIHVGGTNGKGSVSHILASVLQKAGYKTGLHTSPHLIDFRERIKVNGEMAPEDFVIDFIEKHKNKINSMQLSFFELTVFMAFEYFSLQNVDIAVVEVGLGGRLDSTNVITPVLSIITNISLEHTEILGNTLGEIAFEKAGIIKPQIPVIIGETHPDTRLIFESVAADKKSPLIFADQDFAVRNTSMNEKYDKFIDIYKGTQLLMPKVKTSLLPAYQDTNITTAIAATETLRQLGLHIDEKDIRSALLHVKEITGLKGRWDVINSNPITIVDCAHNAHGLSSAMKDIRKISCKTLHLILGFVREKDIRKIFEILPPQAKYYLTKPNVPRALEIDKLAEVALEFKREYQCFQHVKEALISAKKDAVPDDVIYIGGSIFLVSDYIFSTSEE